MTKVTIVGGGLAGLVSSIACAEAGAEVHLLEAHRQLGGRARTAAGAFAANLGPHVLYCDGPLWDWLEERDLLPEMGKPPLGGIRFRHGGHARRLPPRAVLRAVPALVRGGEAPVDVDFRTWARDAFGPHTAARLSAAAGVVTFDADPGRLSAAFVWSRLLRAFTTFPPAARYARGGWGSIVAKLEARAGQLGVVVEAGVAVESLPPAPVIVATSLAAARRLLADDTLRWEGTRTALLDVGLVARRGDPFLISDLDECGWVERFSKPDPTLAPVGHDLLQAQIGLRPGEGLASGVARIEAILDAGYPRWRSREVWRRRSVIEDQTGALDLPGTTWRDRPAIDRGNGVFVAGDMVAAPGLLSEVAWASALEASRLALASCAAPSPLSAGPGAGAEPRSRSGSPR